MPLERNLVKVGNSYFVSLPKDWIKTVLGNKSKVWMEVNNKIIIYPPKEEKK
jgi:antitoxin component of MazEF toxin-antitoxin module